MKRIIMMTVSVLMCMFIFTACKEDTTEMDLAINQHLVGAWSVRGSERNYIDENGLMNIEIFYFTGSKIMYGTGTSEGMYSNEIVEYKIEDGKIKMTKDGKTQFAKLEFLEGTMNWVTDDSVVEYVRIPDEALKEFPIPFVLDEEFAVTETSTDTVSE